MSFNCAFAGCNAPQGECLGVCMLQEYVLLAASKGNWEEKIKFTVEKEKAVETCFQKAKEYNLIVFRA